jgi:hypothetical protein
MITEEEIARLLETEEGRRVLAALAKSGGAEPDDSLPGAFVPEDAFTEGDLSISDTDPISPTMDVPTRGPPLDAIGVPGIGGQIGASPNIRGATIGLPPEISGINPVEENEKNRRRMMQLLIPSWGQSLGMY